MERVVIVGHPEGLHARPAAEFVQTAARFQSRVDVVVGDTAASAHSLLGILKLGIKRGQTVLLRADGPDAAKALETLSFLLERSA